MTTKIKILDKANLLPLEIVLPALAFSIPLFISGPQLLTGSLVNCLLFLVALSKFGKKTILAVALLPSLGALSHGLLFGSSTIFLAYFLPFIMLSNLLLIYFFATFTKNIPHFLAIFMSSLIKAAFLYSFATIYFGLNLVPKLFLSSMGLFQFFTALMGGFLALTIFTFNNSLKK